MAIPREILRLDADAARLAVPDLASVLIDCVEGGASVSFMSPLPRSRAEAFWRGVAESVAGEGRILLVARLDGVIVGTVQVITAMPENQPHRGEIAKLLVARSGRGMGLGAALMAAAEAAARDAGKTLLLLDTASGEAERIYRRQGWTCLGVVPDFALFPDGRPCDTTFFYKTIGAHSPAP